MDGKLTAIPSSTVRNVGGGNSDIPTLDKCREIFDKVFPAYLAIGMTYDEFYRQDHTLVKAYREAYKLKLDEQNRASWLQGLYVYQAISRVAPLLIPFNEHPKAEPYLEKPIPLFNGESKENAESKAVADKGIAYMQAQMLKFNKKFGKE